MNFCCSTLTFKSFKFLCAFHFKFSVDDKLVQKDNRIASLVNKHKENEIGLGELLTEYMLITNEKMLPRNLRHYSDDLN